METMLGMIYIVPFNWAPVNFSICQGQLIAVNQNMALFSLLGTTYGGNGQTNFALPNLQGRAPLGYGRAQSGTTYPIGAVIGNEAVTLTTANMPMHIHTAGFAPTLGTQSVAIPATTGNLQVGVTVNATSTIATTGTPASGTNMLSATGSGSQKVYGPTTTSNLVPLGGTSASVTGTASTAANTANVQTVTGGTVTVQPAGGSMPFNNMQPSLAINFIIAMTGNFPQHP
ncbi:phage tail protein [Methylobacterium oryzisoli]|uniref:phage tail protein n=1 Tax=Methylobacterium oryzisoli TaxID=3385502 RepID=UPI0038915854